MTICVFFKRGKPPAAWLATQEIFMTLKSVRPKKFLGQHFLKDQNVAKAIADTVDACPDIPVLEVGPGMGVLTQYLLPKNRETKVVEIDFESVAYLREEYPQLEENIIEDDFREIIPTTSAVRFSSKCSTIANSFLAARA